MKLASEFEIFRTTESVKCSFVPGPELVGEPVSDYSEICSVRLTSSIRYSSRSVDEQRPGGAQRRSTFR